MNIFFLILFFTSIALPPTSNFRFKRILLIYESFSFSFFISIIVFSLFACDACVVVRICVRYLNKLHNSCVRTDTDKRVLCRSVEFFFSQKRTSSLSSVLYKKFNDGMAWGEEKKEKEKKVLFLTFSIISNMEM